MLQREKTNDAPVLKLPSQMRRRFKGLPKSAAAATSSKPPWRTPDHPPYSQMVEIALRALSEKGGSTESSISNYMQSIFTDLPWGHDRLLPYYLEKFVVSGELSSPSHGRYQLPVHRPPLISIPSRGRRRGRPPLHPQNHPSSPTTNNLLSNPRNHRGRGRKPKILGETIPPLHLEHGSAPSRPRRGRPRLRPEGTIDGTIRRSVPRIPSLRGSMIIQDGFRIRNLSRFSTFCDDKNNGIDLSSALDNPERFELINSQSSSVKAQSLPSNEQFSHVKETPFLPPDHPEFCEQGEGIPFCNEVMCDISSLISSFRNKKKNEDSETCSLNKAELFEHINGGERQPIAAAQPSEYGKGEVSPLSELPLPSIVPVEIISFLAPEPFESGKVKSSQGESTQSPVLEQAELGQDQTSQVEGRPLLSPEKLEIGDNCSEKFQDGNEKRSPEKRTALVALEQESLLPLPPPEGFEVESCVVSSKHKKSRRKGRSLRLWFEG